MKTKDILIGVALCVCIGNGLWAVVKLFVLAR